jgi:hypothetical protein
MMTTRTLRDDDRLARPMRVSNVTSCTGGDQNTKWLQPTRSASRRSRCQAATRLRGLAQ